MGPLLTSKVHEALLAVARAGTGVVQCSLDLERSTTTVEVGADHWLWNGQRYPFLTACKDRTIYYWAGKPPQEIEPASTSERLPRNKTRDFPGTPGAAFQPAARYTNSLIKLVPTEWGPPTFEIDGIKMLPTAQTSPYADAERKVGFIRPRGKVILDTCGGLGYFASWCLQGQAAQVHSYEKSPDVIWLRGLNPWSPAVGGGLTLVNADVSQAIATLPGQSFDAVLHDPPRFGIAGELYSQVFYDQVARVLKPRGILFHYTGTPNKLTSGRDVPNEVANRLRTAGFATELKGDGILATRNRGR